MYHSYHNLSAADINPSDAEIGASRNSIRLATLMRHRWLACIGQAATIIIIFAGFDFELPITASLAVIAAGMCLNLILATKFHGLLRVTHRYAALSLAFDAAQLGVLLYLTGGLINPFSVMLLAPVLLAAGSLPLKFTVALALFVLSILAAIGVTHEPFPWDGGTQISLPDLYLLGGGISITTFMAFSSLFIWRLAQETREMSQALMATEIVLQREQHLSALDGLAAAAAHELGTPLATIALTAREVQRDVLTGSSTDAAEDLAQIVEQTQRCRDILKRLADPEINGSGPLSELTPEQLLKEATDAHIGFDKDIIMNVSSQSDNPPVFPRNPGMLFGLGNIIENAVDFADARVEISLHWTEDSVRIDIIDDGPGFEANVLDRLGEPYVSARTYQSTPQAQNRGGLGLGFFIARSLLERVGARIIAKNRPHPFKGAQVSIEWPRTRLTQTLSELQF